MYKSLKKIISLVISSTIVFSQLSILNVKAIEIEKKSYIEVANMVQKSKLLKQNNEIPSRYDLRDYGYVSPVKDQGNIGACWTFAALGSLESCALKKGNKYDFSEIHMAANNDFYKTEKGGSNRAAASYLASWKGPVLEKDDPYPNPAELSNVKSNKDAKAAFHVQDITFLPPRNNSLDNKHIKNALMKHGAVTGTILYDNKYLNRANASFYNYDEDRINHAILIVGWDDNYPKENFKNPAPENGAFICKNSYGTSFGKNGYFYISYYDRTIGNDNVVFNNLEQANNYEHIYASEQTYDCSNKYVNFHMEVFNPIDNIKEELAAVSFFSHKRNQTYGIYIESEYEDNGFNRYYSGRLKRIKTVTYEEAGFHTVKLDTKVELLKGKKFALIVSKEGSSEPRIFGGNGKEEADNVEIKPLPRSKDMEISRIYTMNKRYTPLSNISLDKTELNLEKDQSFKLVPIITPYNATNDKVKWTSSNEKIAKVSEDGNVTGVGLGETIIKATSVEGNFEAQCKVIVGVDSSLVSLTPGDGGSINPNSEIRVKFDYKLKSFNPEQIYIYDENYVDIEKNIYINNDTLVIKPKAVKNSGGKYIGHINNRAVTNIFNKNLKDAVKFEYILELNKVNNIKFKDKVLENAIKKQLQVENRNLSTDDMKKLTELTIGDNTVDSLEGIQYAINLKKLSIKKSNIISLKPISKLYFLEELSIESSKIKEISAIENLTKLKALTLKDAYIKNISGIRSLSRLTYVDLSGNQIVKIDYIGRLYNLQHLDLHNNFIENIFNLGDLAKIKVCNLDNNLINKISPVKSMILNKDKKDRDSVELSIDNNLIDFQNDRFNDRTYNWLKKNVNSCKNLKNDVNYNKIIFMNNNKVTLDKKLILKNKESIILEFAKEIKLVNKNLIKLTNDAKENIDIDVVCSNNKLIITPKSKYILGASYKLNLNKGAINSLIINEGNRVNADKEDLTKEIPFEKQSIDFELTNSIKGDINKDEKIDIKELANVAQAYGQEVDSTENWDFNVDVNEDGIVDLYDISYISKLIK